MPDYTAISFISPGPNTEPLPVVTDEEVTTDPWSVAGSDADPPEDIG